MTDRYIGGQFVERCQDTDSDDDKGAIPMFVEDDKVNSREERPPADQGSPPRSMTGTRGSPTACW